MTVVLPEVETILGRAAANRHRLEGLLAVLGTEHWPRRRPGDAWDVLGHLQHLATIEPLLLASVQEATRDGAAWLCGAESLEALEGVRESARLKVEARSPHELVERMEANRRAMAESLAKMMTADLDALIRFPPASEWDQPVAIPLRGYLQAWAAHDLDHEAAIREAVTTPPGPSELATAARFGMR